jgi:hypothetical protein
MIVPPPVWHPAPVVAWSAIRAEGARVPGARRIGATVGFVVGLVFAVFGAVVAFALRIGPFEDAPISWVTIAGTLYLFAVVPITGAMGGRVFARTAFGARTRSAWAGVMLGLAMLAVVIGAVLVGFGVLALQPQQLDPWWIALPADIAFGAILGIVGVLFYGVVALPFTLAAAAAWALVIREMQPLPGGQA